MGSRVICKVVINWIDVYRSLAIVAFLRRKEGGPLIFSKYYFLYFLFLKYYYDYYILIEILLLRSPQFGRFSKL
jgi:hypothetical protein